jgi:dTDP-4-dehydrorhamnose 3,5-epimerase-like enzyme
MERMETSLRNVYELRPVVHSSARGAFVETDHRDKFAGRGMVGEILEEFLPRCSSK